MREDNPLLIPQRRNSELVITLTVAGLAVHKGVFDEVCDKATV